MNKTQHTNEPNLTNADSTDWSKCDSWIPLLDCIIDVESAIDGNASYFGHEELWNAQRSIAKLKAFIFLLPDSTVSGIFGSSEFRKLEKSIMQEWAETTMPVDGWSDHLLSQVAGK